MINYKCPFECGCDPEMIGKTGVKALWTFWGKEYYGLRAALDAMIFTVNDEETIRRRLKYGRCLARTKEQAKEDGLEMVRNNSRFNEFKRLSGATHKNPFKKVDSELFNSFLKAPGNGAGNITQYRFTCL